MRVSIQFHNLERYSAGLTGKIFWSDAEENLVPLSAGLTGCERLLVFIIESEYSTLNYSGYINDLFRLHKGFPYSGQHHEQPVTFP
jgi:hypothetical protein